MIECKHKNLQIIEGTTQTYVCLDCRRVLEPGTEGWKEVQVKDIKEEKPADLVIVKLSESLLERLLRVAERKIQATEWVIRNLDFGRYKFPQRKKARLERTLRFWKEVKSALSEA